MNDFLFLTLKTGFKVCSGIEVFLSKFINFLKTI